MSNREICWFSVWTSSLTTMVTRPEENSPPSRCLQGRNYLGHWSMGLLRYLWNLYPGITWARPDHCCQVQLPMLCPKEMTSSPEPALPKAGNVSLKHQTHRCLCPISLQMVWNINKVFKNCDGIKVGITLIFLVFQTATTGKAKRIPVMKENHPVVVHEFGADYMQY